MTKVVNIGGVKIGGGNGIAIQSMTNVKTKDVSATLNQIFDLNEVGCDIVRVSVLDEMDAMAINEIKKACPIPLVADIHFNHVFALKAIENGADKVRINPGNIGGEDKLIRVIDCAKANGAAIRIGVNGGSVNDEFLAKYGNKQKALIESLLAYVSFFEKHAFDRLVLSVKSSSVAETVSLNRELSRLTDYPLHIGVTEAGPESVGIIKNGIGIGSLLLDGIGDTVRVSLTDNPVKEVLAAKEILRACGKTVDGINFISCATCGRCMADMIPCANRIYERIKGLRANLTVAVMGCAVNGPGEAKDADIGIAFGNGHATLFKNGESVGVLPLENIVDVFAGLVEEMADDDRKN